MRKYCTVSPRAGRMSSVCAFRRTRHVQCVDSPHELGGIAGSRETLCPPVAGLLSAAPEIDRRTSSRRAVLQSIYVFLVKLSRLDTRSVAATFISKLALAVEEIDEAVEWLEFMKEGSIATDHAFLQEATELCAIFTASLTTARANWNAELAARRRQRVSGQTSVHVPNPGFQISDFRF